MGNPFPANFEGLDGSRRLTGQVNFTDAANQPGAGLPSQWTVASDGSLTIAISDADGSLRLLRGSLAGARIVASVTDDGGGVEEASVQVTGIGGGSTNLQVSNGSVAGTAATLDGRGQVQFFTETGLNGFEAWDDAGNTLRFALLKAGQPMLGVNAAPADADLAANQCALWFDSTNGVGNTKLMIKGKSADGTVKTAAIVLA